MIDYINMTKKNKMKGRKLLVKKIALLEGLKCKYLFYDVHGNEYTIDKYYDEYYMELLYNYILEYEHKYKISYFPRVFEFDKKSINIKQKIINLRIINSIT
jgi:hypothetical protein